NYADVASSTSAEDNVLRLLAVLSGKGTRALEDLVCLNAGFGLLFMEKVGDVRDGIEAARKAVRSGAAVEQLKATIRVQNQDPAPGLQRLEGLLGRV
ncbi:MAG TPA: hypothetical protein VHM25_16400, partial [Polyangiaceae bacterium]|nr:hypothetical protein [Polyangiaceae bacterium]